MYYNKILERDINTMDKSSILPRLGGIGGASIEIDTTSYIYNGLNKFKERDDDYIKLLDDLDILGKDIFIFV